ncbi:hypothetical protein WSK_2040 [Novosphingobium sp. Rr 2-17]|nr:hypothetical protein WSK_2040 [Novosphingobium sp. Rr 2-17]
MAFRNVSMIVARLGALTIFGEHIGIDDDLGGEIVEDRIGDVDVGLQAETGIPHQGDLRCQAETVGGPIAVADQFKIPRGKGIA